MWVEKRGIATMPAVERLAQALGRHPREFGYAGLKDAHAVTRQWISIEHADEAELRGLSVPGVSVLSLTRHGNKLKLGHLRGNRFDLLLRDVEPGAAARLRDNLADLAQRGAPNYFGEQRFGKRGANLEKGLRILYGNPRKAARRIPKRLLRLLISAVQSEVFNRVLARRIASIDRLLDGDVAFLHANGACFSVEDAAQEQARCDRFEISPSGPLPGPKLLRAQAEPGAIEAAVLAELGVDCEIFGRVPHGTNPGARRPLRIPVADPGVVPEETGLRVTFQLGKGCFATSVLRELLRDAPWFGGETAD